MNGIKVFSTLLGKLSAKCVSPKWRSKETGRQEIQTNKQTNKWEIQTQGGIKGSSSTVVKGDPRGAAVCQARRQPARVKKGMGPQGGGFLRVLKQTVCLVHLNALGRI